MNCIFPRSIFFLLLIATSSPQCMLASSQFICSSQLSRLCWKRRKSLLKKITWKKFPPLYGENWTIDHRLTFITFHFALYNENENWKMFTRSFFSSLNALRVYHSSSLSFSLCCSASPSYRNEGEWKSLIEFLWAIATAAAGRMKFEKKSRSFQTN